MENDEDIEFAEMMEDGRKMRIMMRGVKIGRSKGGGRISIMSIYEKKKEEATE
jgi:small subunit ribosomal protein S33